MSYNTPKLFASLLAASILFCSVSVQAQNRIDKQGRRQGHWIKTDKDGSKMFEGDFVDGRETGTFIYYYPNGQVRIKNTFTVPGKRCSHQVFDQEGHLLATGVYDQKNRDSVWNFFAANGNCVKSASYSMGVLNGQQTIFSSNGDTAEVSCWKNNRRNGRWWKRIGSKGFITGHYEDGSLNGVVKEYDDQGLMVREGHYVAGSKHGSYKYFEGGRLAIDETWNDGILADRKVLVLQPEPAYVSIFKILCMVPMGKDKVVIYTKNGESVTTYEPSDVLYHRTGNEYFTSASRKDRIMVATDCVMGLKKDAEDRDVLDTEPELSFDIFPDEDCLKMIQSLQREGVDQ